MSWRLPVVVVFFFSISGLSSKKILKRRRRIHWVGINTQFNSVSLKSLQKLQYKIKKSNIAWLTAVNLLAHMLFSCNTNHRHACRSYCSSRSTVVVACNSIELLIHIDKATYIMLKTVLLTIHVDHVLFKTTIKQIALHKNILKGNKTTQVALSFPSVSEW